MKLVERCVLNRKEGIFRELGQKIACAAHMVGVPSLEIAILDGMGYIENFLNFMGCN
jgi:hypothetical protein